MSELRGVVGRLAAAIADGERVEWSGVDSLARSDKDDALIKQLRAIATFEKRGASREPVSTGTEVAPSSVAWLILLTAAVAKVLVAVSTLYFLNDFHLTPAGTYRFVYQQVITLAFATAAFPLVRGGRRDVRARYLGHVYLLTAAAFAQSMVELAATQSVLPIANLLRGIYPEAFLPVAVWRFAARFPRPTRFARFDRLSAVMTTVSLTIGAFLFVNSFVLFRWPAVALRAPWLSVLQRDQGRSVGFWLISLCLILAAITISLRRVSLSEREERIRTVWFLTALGVGILPLFVLGVWPGLFPVFRTILVLGGLISVPFTTAYAVLVHRVLNVRLVIHQAMRYALAKYTLSGLIALPVLIPLRLAYLHRDWRIDDLFRDPRSSAAGWLMLIGIVLISFRGRALAVVDRIFLGRHLDHTAALAGTTAAIGRGRTPRELAFEAARSLQEALGVSHVAVLLESRGGDFCAIQGASPDLPQGTALQAMLGETPVVVLSRDGDLFEALPAADREWLTRGEFEVVARVPAPDGAVAGIAGIGSRGNGMPFSNSDLSFIGAVIATAGLALARRRPDESGVEMQAVAEPGAVECELCGAVGNVLTCRCGAAQRPSRLPLIVSKKFAVTRRLGRGGMGVVYLGRDTQLDRKVALKTLPDVTRDAATSMLAEARTMAQVEHPNVALIYSLETWRHTPVLVVEYLAGGTLKDRLDDGPMPVADALKMGAALADGLAALHAAGIIHRDLKPSNIGFTRAGAPKLLDFGVARLLVHASGGAEPLPNAPGGDRLLSNTAVAGTPLYLSPEALNGGSPTVLTDLWSLGVLLLEAIAGEYPFAGRSRADALARVAANAPDWRRARRQLASPLVALFEQLFHRDVSRRPQTAADLRRP